ncbi:MAG: GNAT family N-acetyltransferase [Bacteroidota bacterium]
MYITLETKRLVIRPISLLDAEFLIDLVNSKEWLKFIGNRNISNKKDADNYIENILNNKNFFYSIFELKESNRAIGIVTFLKRKEEEFPDLGFALLPGFEKKGYAFEACKKYLHAIKNLKEHKNIIAITMPGNQKSIVLLKKLGFNYVGDHTKNEEILSYYGLERVR